MKNRPTHKPFPQKTFPSSYYSLRLLFLLLLYCAVLVLKCPHYPTNQPTNHPLHLSTLHLEET